MLSTVSSGDIVYTCTSSATPIIMPTDLTKVIQNHQSRENIQSRILRFVDISVPRNIHSDCGNLLSSVECFNVDDLKQIVERNLYKRKREVIDAEVILREEILKYQKLKKSLSAKALNQFRQSTPTDLTVVDGLSKGVVTSSLRGPFNQLLMNAQNSKKPTMDSFSPLLTA